MTDSRPDVAPPRRGWLRFAAGAVLAVIVLWVVVRTAGGLGDTLRALEHVDGAWIALAVAAAGARLVLYAVQLRLLAHQHPQIKMGTTLRLAAVIYGFGAVTPASPAEGLVIAGSALRRAGLERRDVVMLLGFSEWFTQRSFYLVAALDVFLALWIDRHLTLADAWPYVLAAALVVVVLAVSARAATSEAFAARAAALLSAVRLRRRGPGPAGDAHAAGAQWHADAMRLVRGDFRRTRLAAASTAAVLADAGALWAACRGAQVHISFAVAVLAMAVGTVATWIPLLPAGLGLVEAAVPALLHHFGVPYSHGLVAVVVYRGVASALPALVGALAVASVRAPRRPS